MNWRLLLNSLFVAGGTTLLAVSFGFVAALALSASSSRGRRIWLVMMIASLALPPFLVTNTWLDLLGGNGVLRRWLPLDIYSLGGAVTLLALLMWPITALLVSGAWRKLEASQLEGDPALRGSALLRWLLWPAARGAVGQAAAITFVLALNNFSVPVILQVPVFPEELWLAFTTRLNDAGAWAAACPMVLASVMVLCLLRHAEVQWPRSGGAATAEAFRHQLGANWHRGALLIAALLLALSLGVPAMQLIASRRTWAELPNVFRATPHVVWNSFAYAAVTATACMALGLVIGRASARHARFLPLPATQERGEGRGEGESFHERPSSPQPSPPSVGGEGVQRAWFDHGAWMRRMTGRLRFGPILWLPFLIPGVLLGWTMIAVFNGSFIYGTAMLVVIAFTLRYLAVASHASAQAWRAVDRDLTDAARLSGARGWTLLRHAHWPQLAPPLAAAWYVTYLLCLWDVETLVLLQPPGGETLALRIFNLLHYGHNAQVNALCVTLVALAVAPLAGWSVWQILVRWRNDK